MAYPYTTLMSPTLLPLFHDFDFVDVLEAPRDVMLWILFFLIHTHAHRAVRYLT